MWKIINRKRLTAGRGEAMVAPSSNSSTSTYVSILKAKQGELLAVQTTPPENFIPLFEVVEPAKVAGVGRAWPHADHVAWFQALNAEGLDSQDWADRVSAMLSELRLVGAAVAPVVTLDDTNEVFAVVREAVKIDGRGIVLRIDCEEALEEGPSDLSVVIDRVLQECGVSASECDLVLDAGLVGGAAAVQAGAAQSALDALPHVTTWRNLVVAFSAFPDAVGDRVPPSSVVAIPRTDAAAFNHLLARWSKRTLIYADYAVGVPTYADVKWSPIPNIRYAINRELTS